MSIMIFAAEFLLYQNSFNWKIKAEKNEKLRNSEIRKNVNCSEKPHYTLEQILFLH